MEVITMGSATVDAFADTESELIEIKTKNSEEELIAYPLGTKIPVKKMRYDVGGNGVNVAVGLARLGVETGYIGKVGTDSNGEKIMKRLSEEKIKFLGARGEESGFSIILDSHLGHDRTILGFKGCNNDLKKEELDFSGIKAEWLYLSTMLKHSLETMKEVAKHAKKNGIKIAFNPSTSLARHGIDNIRELLEKTDLLILNDEEAEYLVGKGEPEDNIKKLLKMGIDRVVMTLGENGIKASDGDNVYIAEPKLAQEDIMENTGAGDACSSGFMSGIASGKKMEDCIRMAMLNAESVLRHYGAHNKLLKKEEMVQKLKEDKRKVILVPL